jgi:hypothetical protein
MRVFNLATQRNRRAGRALLLGLLLVAMVLMAVSVARLRTAPDGDVLGASEAFGFQTLPEMVATSHAVVEGTIVETARGPIIDDFEVKYTRKLVRVKVDRLLAGRELGALVTIETAGWRQVEGEAETEFRVEGDIPLTTGDRGIFFLYDFEHTGNFALVSSQGVLLYDGATVRDTDRTDPLVETLEAETVARLDQLVGQAKAAVDRGEVQAKPYPGPSP